MKKRAKDQNKPWKKEVMIKSLRHAHVLCSDLQRGRTRLVYGVRSSLIHLVIDLVMKVERDGSWEGGRRAAFHSNVVGNRTRRSTGSKAAQAYLPAQRLAFILFTWHTMAKWMCRFPHPITHGLQRRRSNCVTSLPLAPLPYLTL